MNAPRLTIIGALLSALGALLSQAFAQTAQNTLRVQTSVAPPFVIQEGDKLAGFSIEVWEEIATRLKVRSVYMNAPTPSSAIEALLNNEVDLSVVPAFITHERDEELDFSHPLMEAGQQVMVRGRGMVVKVDPLRDLVHLLLSRTTVMWLSGALLLLLLPAHVVWFLERRHENSMIPTSEYCLTN